MKINRLLGIVVHLLSREVVSARSLAEKFEVSPRTIQRDVESISLAGIPVGSLQGVNGGYFILDSFKMHRQLLQSEDYAVILAALNGLISGYDSRAAKEAMDKMLALSPDKQGIPPTLQLQLGVMREGEGTGYTVAAVEQAIRNQRIIEFQYTSARNSVSSRRVEPLILTYRWYTWYVFAYCCGQQDYRLFRLSRIRELKSTTSSFTKVHLNVEARLEEHRDIRPYIHVKFSCPLELRVLMEETFPNARVIQAGEELLMGFTVPEEEMGWFGSLLQYGDQITVLEPEQLRLRIQRHAGIILSKYS